MAKGAVKRPCTNNTHRDRGECNSGVSCNVPSDCICLQWIAVQQATDMNRPKRVAWSMVSQRLTAPDLICLMFDFLELILAMLSASSCINVACLLDDDSRAKRWTECLRWQLLMTSSTHHTSPTSAGCHGDEKNKICFIRKNILKRDDRRLMLGAAWGRQEQSNVEQHKIWNRHDVWESVRLKNTVLVNLYWDATFKIKLVLFSVFQVMIWHEA